MGFADCLVACMVLRVICLAFYLLVLLVLVITFCLLCGLFFCWFFVVLF